MLCVCTTQTHITPQQETNAIPSNAEQKTKAWASVCSQLDVSPSPSKSVMDQMLENSQANKLIPKKQTPMKIEMIPLTKATAASMSRAWKNCSQFCVFRAPTWDQWLGQELPILLVVFCLRSHMFFI